jgi:putative hydrolase of the HAD superfamily
MTARIKAVAFDFGNVLCEVDRAACNAALAVHSALSPEEVGRRIWGGDIESEAETGHLDSHGHFLRIKEAISGEGSWDYETFSQEYMSCLRPYPRGEAAALRARELGLRVFIVSNTSFLHSRFIFGREILATVPEIYSLSYKVGAMKPDPKPWLWLLERAGIEAGECLYFDDVPAYCEAASQIGFRARIHKMESGNLARELENEL